MKILKRILLGLLILLALIVIIGFTYFKYMSNRALPDYDKDLSLKGLHAPVEVYRDSFAIPHIYAQDEHDLYLATGYILAQDRLWQMDMLRHVTEGRLSEIFGADYVETDLLLRALRFSEKSDRILAQADSNSLVAINAFADGINLYLEENGSKLPPEFTVLRYKPERWQPAHSLNMIGYMAWDLKAGWSEILLNTIQRTVDSMRYQQILPDLLRLQPTVYPLDYAGTFSSVLPDRLLNLSKLEDLGAEVLEASNNWAISGTKSVSGKPLMANDMHLGLNIPGIWYQMHQVIPGRLNVTGLVLPGAPVIICGHNDSIAWGMTNTYVDNLDFYLEKINPDDSTQYEYKGEWKKFEEVITTIRIGSNESVERRLLFSHRGPVVSTFKKMNEGVVTMHWVGDEMSDEFKAILGVNYAGNWKEFKEALKTFTSISQNIVFADVKGNIGLFCAAGIPVRDREIPFGILPGETDQFDWKGYVPFEELPRTFNPATGYVASANNRTVPRDYPYHIGTWYALPDRYNRIAEMLLAGENMTVNDFKDIQLDNHSKMAEKYMPAILSALENLVDKNAVETKAYDLLNEWDLQMSSTSPAALIFESLYLHFMHCTFADEMGEELFNSFNGITSISRQVTDQIFESHSSLWLDNTHTEDKMENFNDMIVCAFTSSCADLQLKMGDNPVYWEWGIVHQLKLAHPLSSVNILEKTFRLNRGPFSVGGSFHTVSPFSYNSNEPFEVAHGASHRHIFDAGNWDNSYTVIPTGNSGIPASQHYCDQTELYVSGKYHRDHFSKEKVVANARYHMVFKP